MKKRLRKKLALGEYRNPMTYTKQERAGNEQVLRFVQRLIDAVGATEFWTHIQQQNESIPPEP